MSTENIKMQIKKRKRVGRKGKEWESLLMSAPHRGLTKHHITLMSIFVNNCLFCIHVILQTMMQQWRALKHYSTLLMQLELKKKTQGLQNLLRWLANISVIWCECNRSNNQSQPRFCLWRYGHLWQESRHQCHMHCSETQRRMKAIKQFLFHHKLVWRTGECSW